MSNWWSRQLCWGPSWRGFWAEEILSWPRLRWWHSSGVIMSLYSGHLSQWWLQRTAGGLTTGISNSARVCLINAALDIRQSNDFAPLSHSKREDSWTVMVIVNLHFGQNKNIAIIIFQLKLYSVHANSSFMSEDLHLHSDHSIHFGLQDIRTFLCSSPGTGVTL